MSITHDPIWDRIKGYLLLDRYDKDGGHEDPRIRIGFVDLPQRLSQEAQFVRMPCVACGRPIHPLRRREGDGWDRLYYAPACPVTTRPACSRGAAAHAEYERFKGLGGPATQLALFG